MTVTQGGAPHGSYTTSRDGEARRHPNEEKSPKINFLGDDRIGYQRHYRGPSIIYGRYKDSFGIMPRLKFLVQNERVKC